MVYKDIHPVPEIDNELILFRELVKIRNQRSNALTISQGGRITQHLVEYSVMRGNDNYYTYGSTFKDFLESLEYIPEDIKEIIFMIYEFRRDVVLSSNTIKFDNEEMLKFFKAFNGILNWFRYYYQANIAEEGIFFKEMDETINTLNEKINNQNTNDSGENDIYNKPEVTMEDIEEYLHNILPGFGEYLLHKIREAMYEQNQKWEERHDELRQDNQIIIQYQENMDAKLDDISDHINELTNIIHSYKKDIDTEIKNAKSDEEEEKIISEFTNRCIDKIIEQTKDYTNSYVYKEEEKKLKETFKETWEKLSEESQTFLVTAKFTYRQMAPSKFFDYSAVCLPVTKALELETYKRFFRGFSDYLFDEHKKSYDKYHTKLLKWDNNNKKYYRIYKPKDCDLGRITCILGFNDWGIKDDEEYENNMLKIIEYSKKHIFKGVGFSDEVIREKLLEYGEQIDNIRRDFRNPAAHTNKLKIIKAEECFKYIIDGEKVLIKMLETFDECCYERK